MYLESVVFVVVKVVWWVVEMRGAGGFMPLELNFLSVSDWR